MKHDPYREQRVRVRVRNTCDTRGQAEVAVDPARRTTLVPASRLTCPCLGGRSGTVKVDGDGGLASSRRIYGCTLILESG